MPMTIPGVEISARDGDLLNQVVLGRNDAELLALDAVNHGGASPLFIIVASGSARDKIKARLYDEFGAPDEDDEPEGLPADIVRALVPVTTGAQDTQDAKARRDGSPTAAPVGGPRPLVQIIEGITGIDMPSDGVS